ncbi:hypothetical protein [Brevibacterium oceani]|uniref:hypothetical protein n=1 Tax=Brevibacterium oceani TaxID=358099 RepID=UPI0015E6C2D6|nr:hypothetical protein [Brevibacterium oceani]
MTTIDAHRTTDALDDEADATYDLIILRRGRIVFHDHYESPAHRLRMAVGLLTASDLVADAIDADACAIIRAEAAVGDPDGALNRVAKICRDRGVDVYMSTTRKRIAVDAPTPRAASRLYSVITDYGQGQMIAEHFATREQRRQELVARAEQFFDAPGNLPEQVLTDDQRLAALVATFLMPATVSLTEAAFDPAEGSFRPAGHPLPIH